MTAVMDRKETTGTPVWEEPLVALYRERYAPMVRLAYLLTSDRAVAEELVQDAFVAVHRNWARATQPSAYLRTAVVNNCRSWGRRKVMEIERRPRPAEPATLVADEMWDILQTLPTRQRAAVVLRFYEDLPDRQIAELLGCREGTVRTTIHRALAALRKEISR